MKLILHFAIIVSVFVAVSRSNPNPRKGELMEVVILKETQGNYEEALNAFEGIGELTRNSTVNLSFKERKIFYDCYHYRRLQLLKDVIDGENNLKKDIANNIMNYFDKINVIYQELTRHKEYQDQLDFDGFTAKLKADRLHFETWYFRNYVEAYMLEESFGKYDRALFTLKACLGDADTLLLDACLGVSTTKLELNTLYQKPADSLPCETAKTCLEKGGKASSNNNEDLIPLSQFVKTYCKPNAPNIVDKYSFKRA